MISSRHYRYSVQWSVRDNEFVGTVAEFPSLSWLAPTEDAALAGISRVTAEVVADMSANGEEVPVPLAERDFSGKLLLRIPPELHRRLAAEAADNQVSLNRLLSTRLANAHS